MHNDNQENVHDERDAAVASVLQDVKDTNMRRIFELINQRERTIQEIASELALSVTSVRCALLALRRQNLVVPQERRKVYVVAEGARAPIDGRGRWRGKVKDARQA